MSEFLSIQQAAQRLGVSIDTLRQWERAGRLKAERTEGGHRRFRASDIERLLVNRAGARRESTASSQSGAPPSRGARSSQGSGGFCGPVLPTLWQDRVREARAKTEVLKLRREAGELLAAREEDRARSLHDFEEAGQRERHRHQLETLKEFGRSLVQARLPAEWRAEVANEMERYVTPERFPPTLPASEARAFVEARVQAGVQRYHMHCEQLEARQQRERLIEAGRQRALSSTVFWDPVDRAQARDEVMDRLREEVASDWTYGEVQALVNEILREWQEGDDEIDDEDDEEELDEECDEEEERDTYTEDDE